ncbi:hypothetical protein Hte_001929 [Hypoxylon texense]
MFSSNWKQGIKLLGIFPLLIFLNALRILATYAHPSVDSLNWPGYPSPEYQIPNAQVLAVHLHLFSDEVDLRVLVDNVVEGKTQQSIKYVKLLVSSWPDQGDVSLPVLPPGDWNEATMKLDEKASAYDPEYRFMPLPGLSDVWHPVKIDYLDLKKVKNLKTVSRTRRLEKGDFLQVVTHPVFSNPVLMKISSFPDQFEHAYSDNEVAIYKQIEGLGIAPRFLGHVTEHGRVIGFLLEYLDDATTVSEIWNEETENACRASLEKLHSTGIAHRDAHRGNCLIRKDGSAVLIDFEISTNDVNDDMFTLDLDTIGYTSPRWEKVSLYLDIFLFRPVLDLPHHLWTYFTETY